MSAQGIMYLTGVEIGRIHSQPQEMTRQLFILHVVGWLAFSTATLLFSGRRFWEFQGHELVADFPESGLPLTDLGIESLVERIDAAAVGLGTLNRRTYLFSGYEYWRLREDRMVVDRHYPQQISHVFRGVPPNVDAAFTNVDGNQSVVFILLPAYLHNETWPQWPFDDLTVSPLN